MAQETFQLRRPNNVDNEWAWPGDVPTEVLFDPLSTVSATYGVAFQTQFRDDQNMWSSRPAIFVIDRDGVLRHVDSHEERDIREDGIFAALDELEHQRTLIAALGANDEARREAARIALAPIGEHTKAAVPHLVKALRDESVQARAAAATALYWIAPKAETAVPALSEALQDRDSRVRRLSSLALARLGPAARSA